MGPFIGRRFASSGAVRLEKATFGPVLRTARERKGITLRQLAAETKISVELWAALEENNLARWPRQVFARSYVRDYALRVGLDADEVVNEFCRLFPEWGDRRAERIMRGHAEIVSHALTWEDLPAPDGRRASDRYEVPGVFSRHRTRILAVVFDLKIIFGVTGLAVLLKCDLWPSLGVTAVAYSVASTALTGRSFGLLMSEWVFRALKSWPGARRLVSWRVEGA
jgi:transcriptional regulator with XRE-family HTH domain